MSTFSRLELLAAIETTAKTLPANISANLPDIETFASARLVEIAHTPQLPHLGIFRLYLEAGRCAAANGATVVTWFNDHLPPRALTETTGLYWTDRGTAVREPPRFVTGLRKSKAGMNRLPPPTDTDLEAFRRRWIELSPKQNQEGIAKVCDQLADGLAACGSLGAWLVSSLVRFLPFRPLVVTSSAIYERFETLRRAHPALDTEFWRHCPSCFCRASRFDTPSEIECRNCGTQIANGKNWVPIPSVELRQALSNGVGYETRVIGVEKPYIAAGAALGRSLFGHDAIPSHLVMGRTTCTLYGEVLTERPPLLRALSAAPLSHWPPPPADPMADWSIELDHADV